MEVNSAKVIDVFEALTQSSGKSSLSHHMDTDGTPYLLLSAQENPFEVRMFLTDFSKNIIRFQILSSFDKGKTLNVEMHLNRLNPWEPAQFWFRQLADVVQNRSSISSIADFRQRFEKYVIEPLLEWLYTHRPLNKSWDHFFFKINSPSTFATLEVIDAYFTQAFAGLRRRNILPGPELTLKIRPFFGGPFSKNLSLNSFSVDFFNEPVYLGFFPASHFSLQSSELAPDGDSVSGNHANSPTPHNQEFLLAFWQDYPDRENIAFVFSSEVVPFEDYLEELRFFPPLWESLMNRELEDVLQFLDEFATSDPDMDSEDTGSIEMALKHANDPEGLALDVLLSDILRFTTPSFRQAFIEAVLGESEPDRLQKVTMSYFGEDVIFSDHDHVFDKVAAIVRAFDRGFFPKQSDFIQEVPLQQLMNPNYRIGR